MIFLSVLLNFVQEVPHELMRVFLDSWVNGLPRNRVFYRQAEIMRLKTRSSRFLEVRVHFLQLEKNVIMDKFTIHLNQVT